MNSDSSEGNSGGVIIKPSARRSIHSYKDDRLRSSGETMGRYGLNKSNNENGSQVVDKGVDEVDNVMSKMARQTSPVSIRKIQKIQRTNSYSQDEDNSDDSTINVLSKSLPATLPSNFHYSDDSDVEDSYSNSFSKSRAENESYHSMKNRSNISLERPPTSQQQRNLSISRENVQPQSGNTSRIILSIILCVIAVVIYFILKDTPAIHTQEKSTQTNYDEIKFENNLRNLQEKYNIEDDSILQLKSGISTIISNMDTGSFIFVYNGNKNNFDHVKFGKFTDEVAYTAAKYLRSDMSSIRHTVVESSNLDMQEHGELISRYRDDVNRSGVMLVKEVDAVPSDLAMAFHYYCDEYNPLVKKSAIFFTLNKANCSNTSVSKTTHAFVEKCLTKKWKTVSPENIRPLLTRVVNVVIDVTSAF